MTPILRSILVLATLILLVTSATGNVLSVQNCDVTAGSTASVDIVLDEAPGGLSGYSINVTIEDPSVATVSAVSFPSWASLNETSSLPSPYCRIKASDLSEHMQAGAKDITLATMTIQGLSTGATAVALNVSMMNDDTDGNISPVLEPGTLSVTASAAAYEPEEYYPGPSPATSLATTMATAIPTTLDTSGSSGGAGGASTMSVEKTARITSTSTVSQGDIGEKTRVEVPEPTGELPDALPIAEPSPGFPPPLTSPLMIGGMAILVISSLVVLFLAVRGKL